MSGALLFRTPAGELRSPWRVAVFGGALVVAGVVVTGIAFSIASFTAVTAWARLARIPLDQVALVTAFITATWLTGRVVHGATHDVWTRVGLARAAWRPAILAVPTLAGTLAVAVPALAMIAGGAMRVEAAAATDSAAMMTWTALALMLPAAIGEELLVRGYLLSACRDGMGTPAAIVVTSALFGLAHLGNPDPTAMSLVAVTCAGLFLAVVRVATGSLVAAIAAHLAFNLTQAVVLHAPVSGLALQTPGYRLVPVGPDWLTGGAWGPEGGAGVIVALAVATFIVSRTGGTEWNARRTEQPQS